MADVAADEVGEQSYVLLYKGLLDESWVLRLTIILCAYSTLALPAYFVIRYVKNRQERHGLSECRPFRLYSFLVRFSVGLDQRNYLPLATSDTSTNGNDPSDEISKSAAGPRSRFQECVALILCFLGVQSSLILMGFLQERTMTQKYAKISSVEGEPFVEERFGDTQFLMLINRLFTIAIYGSYILYNHRRQPPHVPPYYVHSFTSLSNTMSSWCQYEALKYASFPATTVCKASKIIPTMIMGVLVRNQHYSMWDYGNAAALAFGASLFFLTSAHSKPSSDVPIDYGMTVSGLVLMILFLTFDSFTPNWQKSLFDTKPSISKYQMIVGTSIFSAILCLVSLAEQATLFSSMEFFLTHEGFPLDACILSLSGAVSQFFIYTTIELFGPIVLTIIMTIRQMLSIIVSTIYFGHGLTAYGAVGFCVVFVSLFLSTYRKYYAHSSNPK